jgi:hypothetical protein
MGLHQNVEASAQYQKNSQQSEWEKVFENLVLCKDQDLTWIRNTNNSKVNRHFLILEIQMFKKYMESVQHN